MDEIQNRQKDLAKSDYEEGKKMYEALIPVKWEGDHVSVLDQTLLPTEEVYLEIKEIGQMWDAIKRLCVRGAPAIGIAAAYGVAVEMQKYVKESEEMYHQKLRDSITYLATSRPTAVNLFWALKRMEETGERCKADQNRNEDTQKKIEQAAKEVEAYETAACVAIGENALTLLEDGMGILTHCNAGGLATVRYGTALAPILLGKEKGINFKVYADETRPLLQGARLTAYELYKAGVDVTVITDNMSGMVMKQGKINAIIVGCDRVAANGDAANKIGTYSVAVLAKHHGIPFYVAGPVSTIDLNTPTGEDIPIEERVAEEITCGFGKRTVLEGTKVYNPAFDVTPHELITAIITDKGIIKNPCKETVAELMSRNEG